MEVMTNENFIAKYRLMIIHIEILGFVKGSFSEYNTLEIELHLQILLGMVSTSNAFLTFHRKMSTHNLFFYFCIFFYSTAW